MNREGDHPVCTSAARKLGETRSDGGALPLHDARGDPLAPFRGAASLPPPYMIFRFCAQMKAHALIASARVMPRLGIAEARFAAGACCRCQKKAKGIVTGWPRQRVLLLAR
jgi:hypothetical protein